jgi:hypothetical protein
VFYLIKRFPVSQKDAAGMESRWQFSEDCLHLGMDGDVKSSDHYGQDCQPSMMVFNIDRYST